MLLLRLVMKCERDENNDQHDTSMRKKHLFFLSFYLFQMVPCHYTFENFHDFYVIN